MEYLMGFQAQDFVALALRLVLGVFFVLARFRWVYDPSRPEHCWFNPQRHEHLVMRLCTCGYGRHPLTSAIVALSEVSAGVALILGFLTIPAAFVLLCILIFATLCTARDKVKEQNPVDKVDCISCYLWRVEGVYVVLALGIILNGPGKYSLDYLFLHSYDILGLVNMGVMQ